MRSVQWFQGLRPPNRTGFSQIHSYGERSGWQVRHLREHISMPHRENATLRNIYDLLWAEYGPQHWWPADSATEVIIGAILTQNTAWKNVEHAIKNLKQADYLSWLEIRNIETDRLEKLLKPAGTYRIKARRLKGFVETLWKQWEGSHESLLSGPTEEVRCRLLAISGIGPETADAILLYAGNHPIFVVDTYTKRILRRHGVIDDSATYGTIQSLFHQELEPSAENVQVFNEYHALLVELGKRHCRTKAICTGCPLEDLPHKEQL